MNRIDLDGQVAVVTGGAQGLGLAMARRMIQSGAKVSLWDVDDTLLGEATALLGDAAKSVKVDITDAAAVAAAHAKSEAELRAGIDPGEFGGHRRAEPYARRISG